MILDDDEEEFSVDDQYPEEEGGEGDSGSQDSKEEEGERGEGDDWGEEEGE